MPQGHAMHDIDLCKDVYVLREQNPEITYASIARKLGLASTQHWRKMFSKWINDPDRFSPFLDEVALQRAKREKAVYDRLTIYENQVFWERAADELEKDDTYNRYEPKRSLARYASTLDIDERSVSDNARRARLRSMA